MHCRPCRGIHLVVLLPLLWLPVASALGGVSLTVWDNGGEQDDQADVYFDGSYLGRNDAPYARTWNLGELSGGSYTLRLQHVVYNSETGTYAWELSGGGLLANDDEASVLEDGEAWILVLENDTSTEVADGASPVLEPLQWYETTIVVESAGPSVHVDSVSDPVHGTASIQANAILYVPDPDYAGVDTFTYRAQDASGRSASASVTVTVIASNDPPTAVDDQYALLEDAGATSLDVLANDQDPEQDPLSISFVTSPFHGTAAILDGIVSYTPNPDYCGGDSFDYSVSDGQGGTGDATVLVQVECVNDSPVATADKASVTEASFVEIDVLGNDDDLEGDPLQILAVTSAERGSVEIVEGSSLLYRPESGACGSDHLRYTIGDGQGGTAESEVEITIINLPPRTGSDTAETQEGEPVWIQVLRNDADPGNAPLTLVSAGDAAHGATRIAGDAIEYRPAPRFEGDDAFTYVVRDSCGSETSGVVHVEVQHTNHPPTADAGHGYRGITGEPITLDAGLSRDPDVEDRLEYRWDLTSDGRFDTAWQRSPLFTATYETSFRGEVTLEVRDVYRGVVTGQSAQARAPVEIRSEQSVRIDVFVDRNGDGQREDGEPGLPDLGVLIAQTEVTTDANGTAHVLPPPGEWIVKLTNAAAAWLNEVGYTMAQTETLVSLQPGEAVAVLFPAYDTQTTLKGFVFVDVNANDQRDVEDSPIGGLQVVLDEDIEHPTSTDLDGRFFFFDVPYGKHSLYLVEPPAEGEEENLRSLLIQIDVTRESEGIVPVVWPWAPAVSPEGFLRIRVLVDDGH